MSDTWVPVGDVADRFDLSVSTLHYWERRGLVTPHRRAGRRYYDAEHLYRIALIRLWRDTGLMSLEEIAAVLAGRTATHTWRDTVTSRIAALEAQTERLDTARGYLRYMLECTRDNPAADCLQFREEVRVPAPKGSPSRPGPGPASPPAIGSRGGTSDHPRRGVEEVPPSAGRGPV
ncbi:MerR family transcriptional regulator [Streptomyces sp. SID3343]|uniref:helix-turn-helix domain-containing protein n=1 Tax=Streptomyces sp. SID3343 TaxID=2690260 RepID=UPI00136AEE65|nr:MerR family transcriptional regulator [Streptomyces sp. SID3343]MYW00159.1 MerR family transcriptional regulator [Streptomyces sp. SID3343]